MELKELFHKEISYFEADLNSKEQVIEFLSQKLKETNFIKNDKEFIKAINKREEEGSTGVGDGIAIPHILNKTVNKSAIAFIKLKNQIDWNSLDNKPVDLVFAIITNGKDGNEHLEALANLSGVLMKSESQANLRKAKSINDIYKVFETKKEVKKQDSTKTGKYDVVAITACPTGIAHTYMAAEKLEEYAKQLGLTIKVETQGRRGIENRLSADDINSAKVIILAHDKALEGLSRFNGKQVIDTSTKDAIFNGTTLIKEFNNNKNLKTISASQDSSEDTGELTLKKFLDFKGNLLGGVSRMLPFVVAGGIILGIAFLIDFASGNGEAGGEFGTVNPAAGWFAAIGKLSMSMMVPILGGYIAYSIVGPQGLMPGVVAGLMSSNIMGFAYAGKVYNEDGELILAGWSNLWGKLLPENLQGYESGFIGALVGGYFAALLVYGWMKAMNNFPKSLQGARDIVFIPVASLLSISLTMFVINIPLGLLMNYIGQGIGWLAENNLILLVSTLIGFMMCVDMGGPINKIAYTLGNAAVAGKLIKEGQAGYSEQTIIMAASMLAGMLPPLMIAMSTVIFPRAWAAKANWLMGACFVSEGAIPFMVKDPKRVAVSAMVGGTLIGLLVGAFQIKLGASHGGVFVFALINTSMVDSGTLTGASIATGISLALLILLGSSAVSAIILGIWRTADIKTGKLVLDSSNGLKESLEAKIASHQDDKEKLEDYKKYELELKTKQAAYQERIVQKQALKAKK